MHIFQDGSSKRPRLDSAEWGSSLKREMRSAAGGLSIPRAKRHCMLLESCENGANFRSCVNEKARSRALETMNFLGWWDEIHSA